MTPEPSILSGPSLPYRLADLEHPPSFLLVRGELPRGPAVGIVGTREATSEGKRFAARLAGALARDGLAVLSGGALGIDTAAHLGALRASGRTAVIAPAGFDRPYPEENVELFRRIIGEGGAYASLVSDDTPARPGAFFARNGCLVALAHLVVVVEAGLRSGAGNAASWARKLGRPLLVVPHSPWRKKGRGCNQELRRGARVCEGPRDVHRELERLLLQPIPLARPVQAGLPFDPAGPDGPRADAERVIAAIAAGAGNVDEVSGVTGLSAATIQRQILTLALDGVLAPDRSGRLSLTRASCKPTRSKA